MTMTTKHPEPAFRLPYEEMEWVWVCNHYDVHLDGLCRVNGKLMRFEHAGDEGSDGVTEMLVYRLSPLEQLRWRLRQRLFELCVGKHWSYPERRNGVAFRLKQPRWFWKLVFNLYYKRSPFAKI